MNIIDALNLKKPQDYPSREAYQQDVVKAVQVLMRLGIMDSPSADLKQVNSEIVELDREIADLEWQIALKKAEISVNEAS
jgi:hypothetical protein